MKIKKVDSIEDHQGVLKFSDLSAGDSFRWVCNPSCLCIKVTGCYGVGYGYVKLGTGTQWASNKDSNNISENREVKKVVAVVHYI